MNRLVALVFIIGSFFALVACAPTDVMESTPETVSVEFPTNAIRIGDAFPIRLKVQHPMGSRVELPVLAKGRDIVQRSVVQQSVTMGSNALSTYQIVLSSLIPSNHVVEADGIRILGPADRVVTHAFPFVQMSVVSMLQGTNTVLRDAKGLAHWPARSWPWLVAACLVLLLLAVGWLYLRSRASAGPTRPIAPERPPHERALEQLQVLSAKGYAQRGDSEPFYVELSAILRRYLEERFGLRAPEQTTDEFLREALGSHALTGDQQKQLESFLTFSDLVKFARHVAAAEDMNAALNAADRFIRETAPVVRAEPPK